MDKYLKKFQATDYGQCIIKEELIIPDDEEDNNVAVKTEPIDENYSDTVVEVIKPNGQIKRKRGRPKNKNVNARNEQQSTLDSFFKSKSTESNEQLEDFKNITDEDEPESPVKEAYTSNNIDQLLKKLTKSHCSKCKVKRAVIRRKARCPKCKTKLTYSCESCDTTYCTFTNLSYHLQIRHTVNRETHPCPVCKKSFAIRKVMLAHRRIRHDSVVKSLTGKQSCVKCGEKFESKNITEHEKVCDKEAPFKCDKCPFATIFQSNLTSHISKKHTDFREKCAKCKKIFKNRISMKRHLRIYCNKSKRFECHHCGHKFYRKDELLKHLDQAHFTGKLTNDPARICKFCDNRLGPYEHMRYHLDRCESAPLSCRLANEAADQPDLETACKNLSKAHCENCKIKRPLKQGERRCKKCDTSLRFICEKCPKSYNYAQLLLDHLQAKHVKNKSEKKKFYRCDKCNCSYSRLTHLKRHKTTHHLSKQTTKMYECSKCGKSYKNFASFRKHRISCVEEPKFHCNKCSYKTHFKTSLIEHFRAKRETCI